MKLFEKYSDIIHFTQSEEDIKIYEEIISSLESSKLKNIAVLGEMNCGKTSLINKLSGAEARKTTKISLDEMPLMVTFHSDETRDGYEKVDLHNEKCQELGVAFYEIPINQAVEYETGRPTKLLEEMDAVIYVMSAIMPFTSADVANLRSVVDQFPLLIWNSKTDMLDGEQEYQDCSDYIRTEFFNQFKGSFCEFYDGKNENAIQEILERFGEMGLEEIREFHIQQVEQQVKNILAGNLDKMLEDIKAKRQAREAEKGQADQNYRQQILLWNDIRLAMLEKEQETIDYGDKKISNAKISAKKNTILALKDAKNKQDWIQNEFKPMLETEIQSVAREVLDDVKDLSDSHVAWLISEVNRKFSKALVIDDMRRPAPHVEGNVEKFNSAPDYKKAVMAAGSGLVAGGAILSGLSLVPTCIVAIPASLVTLTLIRDSMKDHEEYNERLLRFVEECCDKNFAKLTKKVHDHINYYYEKVVAEIMAVSETGAPEIDFRDISDAEDAIKDKIRMLSEN